MQYEVKKVGCMETLSCRALPLRIYGNILFMGAERNLTYCDNSQLGQPSPARQMIGALV